MEQEFISAQDWDAAFSNPRTRAILEKAGKLFVSPGYHFTTMAAIAREAEISKATLYRFFPNKEKVFRAFFFWRFSAFTVPQIQRPPIDDLEAALHHKARKIIRYFTALHVSKLMYILAGVSRDFPELIHFAYYHAPLSTQFGLEWLFIEGTRNQELWIDDFKAAGRQFVLLCRSPLLDRLVFLAEPEFPEEELEEIAATTVRIFLARYRHRKEEPK